MAVVLDTGIVYAYYDRRDAWHDRARQVIAAEHHGLILPAPTIPEIDHLLGRRLGVEACRALYAGLETGAYITVDLSPTGYTRVAQLNRSYPDLGFVDAAIISIAEERRVLRIATTDRRHFEPLAGPLSLTLLP